MPAARGLGPWGWGGDGTTCSTCDTSTFATLCLHRAWGQRWQCRQPWAGHADPCAPHPICWRASADWQRGAGGREPWLPLAMAAAGPAAGPTSPGSSAPASSAQPARGSPAQGAARSHPQGLCVYQRLMWAMAMSRSLGGLRAELGVGSGPPTLGGPHSGGLTHQQLLGPVVEHGRPGGEGRCEGLGGLRPSCPQGSPAGAAASPVHQAEQVPGLAAAGEAREQRGGRGAPGARGCRGPQPSRG